MPPLPSPRRRVLHRLLMASLLPALPPPAAAQPRTIVVASTTSTEQSGLFAHLLPAFRRDTGIEVRVIGVGTGQALDIGRRGDADVVFVHDQAAEERFVAEGFGVRRVPVMANDFVLVGPQDDPAGAAGRDIAAAMGRLAASAQPFVSRGDGSGTHAAERRFWRLAGVDVGAVGSAARAPGRPAGYRECGCGMGPALNIAAQSGAYVLADRGTWLAFRNRAGLRIVVQGDPRMFNPYGAILVNPARHPHVRHADAQAFVDWLVSPRGQAAIAGYRIDGEPLFFPNAAASTPK